MKKIFTLLLVVISFNSFSQTLTEVIVPQYMQGLNGTNANRVPYAYRVTLSGLTANATYRYTNQVVISTDAATSGGAGNIIFANATGFTRTTSPSLSTAGGYGEFTTNANGSYTGWFITEPSGNATRFLPGNTVYLRIALNNGNGGTTATTYLTTTSGVTIINFGTSGANTGTAIYSTTTSAAAKNFIMLYDNTAGTGRPIAGTFVESDGTANTTANSYSSFYATNVDGVDKAWGTIIPNALPNGIRQIAQFSLADGSLVGINTDTDGTTWAQNGSGIVSTVNPTGGTTTPIVLDGSIVKLPVTLKSITASLINNQPQLTWETSNETNFDYFGVEKSFDAKNFAEIAKVASNKANNGSTYQYADINKTLATQFYRLKLVDNDGTFKYSSVVAVNAKPTISLALYPNPVTNTIILSHPKAIAGAAVKVVSVDGKILSTQNVQTGATQTSIDATRLVKGNYVVSFVNDGVATTTQLIKQ